MTTETGLLKGLTQRKALLKFVYKVSWMTHLKMSRILTVLLTIYLFEGLANFNGALDGSRDIDSFMEDSISIFPLVKMT
jgi:hypothetical protein